MRKLLCFIVTVCVVLGLSAVVLAAPTVEVSYEGEEITVSGVTTPGDEVTILVLAPYEVEISEDDIMYIDQMTSDATTGEYSFTFLMRDGAQEGDYDVWVGGTGVDNPETDVITYDPSGDTPDFTYGDVDGNGSINMTDVVFVVRAIVQTYELNEVEALAADVDGNEVINMTDVVYIVRYIVQTLDEFPAASN